MAYHQALNFLRSHEMGLREECGVVGVGRDSEASNLIYLSLYALQHRGQEAAGIVTINKEGKFSGHKTLRTCG